MQFVQRDFCNQWLQTFFKEQLRQPKVFYLNNKISCFCFPCTCPIVELRIFFFGSAKTKKTERKARARAHGPITEANSRFSFIEQFLMEFE